MVKFYSAVGLASAIAFYAGLAAGDRKPAEPPRSPPAPVRPTPVTALLERTMPKTPESLPSQWHATESSVLALADGDPHAALAELDSLALPFGVRAELRRKIFTRWAASAPEEAALAAEAIDDPLQRASALKGIATGWANHDPAAALTWAAALTESLEIRLGAMAAVLTTATGRDPQATAELALTLPVADLVRLGNTKTRGWPPLVGLVRTLGEADAQRGFRMLEGMPKEAVLAMILSHVPSLFASPFQEMCAADPELALRLANAFPSGSQAHAIALCDALRGLAEIDPERALGLAADLPLKAQKFALDRGLHHLAKRDPVAAAEFAIKQTQFEPHESYSLFERYLNLLAKQDAAGAAHALSLLPQIEHYQDNLRTSIIASMARHDPQAAMAQLAGGADDTKARFEVVNVWAKADAEGLRTWLGSAGDEMQHIGRVALANITRRQDLEAAAEVLAKEASYPFHSDIAWRVADVIEDVAVAMADENFDRAVTWLASLGDSPVATRAATELAKLALTIDGAAASEWIAVLPPGPSRDAAAKRLVENLRESDPQAAFQWSIAIGDPEIRNNQLSQSTAAFYRADPDASNAAIRELPSGELRDGAIEAVSRWHREGDPIGLFELGQLMTADSTRTSVLTQALARVEGTDSQRALVEALPPADPARPVLLKQVERWENPTLPRFGRGFGTGF